MRWTSIVAIYLLFWALSVFLVLPFGVRTHAEAGAERVPGQADSAPHGYSFGKLVLRTTIVAAVLFGLYYANYVNGWITPADMDYLGTVKD
jgi:predicted secreted protein